MQGGFWAVTAWLTVLSTVGGYWVFLRDIDGNNVEAVHHDFPG